MANGKARGLGRSPGCRDSGCVQPANILLANGHDGALRPVVIDFGIAHLNADTRVTGGRSTPTQVGSRIGTPAYMSPEQIRGQPVSPRSDVFALGAVLYEVLTGATAFDGADAFEVQRAIIDGAFVELRQRRADLPVGLERVVHKALRTDPTARFGSCAEMRKELDDAWVSDLAPAPEIAGNRSATGARASRAVPPAPVKEHPAASEPLAPPVFEPPVPEPPAPAPGGGCLVALATFVGAIAGSCWMPCIGTVLGGLLAWWIASKLTTQAPSE